MVLLFTKMTSFVNTSDVRVLPSIHLWKTLPWNSLYFICEQMTLELQEETHFKNVADLQFLITNQSFIHFCTFLPYLHNIYHHLGIIIWIQYGIK